MQCGLRIRCVDRIEPQLKDIIIEFGTWLRKKINFPNRLFIYVRNKYKSKTNSDENFLASFFAPYNKDSNPYIRIDIENHKVEGNDSKEFRHSILISIAHEIVHYMQWIGNISFYEKEAEDKSEQLVEQFLEDRIYNLTITSKAKKLIELADLKSSFESFDEAIVFYTEAIEMGCEDEVLYNAIGYCYDCAEKFDKSLLYYDMALALNSDHPALYMNKGYALYHLDKFNEAIENYNKSLDIDPNKEVYVFKANAEERLGNYNQAIECYEEAIKLDSNYDIAYNEKGLLLYNINKLDEARKACMRAISISTDYADAYYNLSLIFAKLGEFNTSMDYLKIAIDLDEQYKDYAQDESVFNGYLKTIL